MIYLILGEKMIKEFVNYPYYNGDSYHLSELAKCGKRYAYERKHRNKVEHMDIWDVGLAWEYYLTNILEKHFKIGTVKNNDSVDINIGGLPFIGHIDISVYPQKVTTSGKTIGDMGEKHIIDFPYTIFEVKYSESRNNYYDIYSRQLRAYGTALYLQNKEPEMWLEMYNNKHWKEQKLKPITQEDIDFLNIQVKAFQTQRYQKGIENSLCKICPLFQFCNAESIEDYGEPIWQI